MFILLQTYYMLHDILFFLWDNRGVDRKIVCNQCITTNVVGSKSAHDDVRSIQHYVIKFSSALRQVGCFLRVLQFPPLIKFTVTT